MCTQLCTQLSVGASLSSGSVEVELASELTPTFPFRHGPTCLKLYLRIYRLVAPRTCGDGLKSLTINQVTYQQVMSPALRAQQQQSKLHDIEILKHRIAVITTIHILR